MTNREKLLHTSEYDLLCRMNSNITSLDVEVCVLDIITGKMSVKCYPDIDTTGYADRCAACIAAWLNSEYDGRW